MKKEAILQKFRTERVIALIRADNPDGLLDCAKALAEGGLTSIELTMTTPGAIRMLEKATSELPDFLFGLGTVLDAETARAGILSGAKFIVTPALRPDVITLCKRYSVPIFSGAFTPTESSTPGKPAPMPRRFSPPNFLALATSNRSKPRSRTLRWSPPVA